MVQLMKCQVCLKLANPFDQGRAPFRIYQSKASETDQVLTIAYCPACHDELSGTDRAKLKEFYERV